ncbi:MAG: hypothetical protein MJ071_03260 [Oscillospiraceae bacterium]|nr:hypothetical protein [Oscillospiraceae bacterium]
MSKRIIILLIAIGAVIVFMAGATAFSQHKKAHQPEESQASEESYSDEMIVIPSKLPEGIELEIPTGFTETSSSFYDCYYVKEDASIIITGEESSIYNITTEEYADLVKQQYMDTTEQFQLVSEETFPCSGTECKLFRFTYAIVGAETTKQMECLSAVAVKDNFIYLVTCKSSHDTFSGYLNVFRQMLSTMKIADAFSPSETSASAVSSDTESAIHTETSAETEY